MKHNLRLNLLKAIADPSRLRLLDALLKGPQCLEELTQRLALAPSTVSFHLKKLEHAKLVNKLRDQYYTVYTLNVDKLNIRLRDLVETPEEEHNVQDQRLEQRRVQVLKTFFEGNLLKQLPVQKKKQRIVLDIFAADFKTKKDYSENEVNRIIQERFNDYVLIRRLLVDQGDMDHNQGFYRRSGQKAQPDISLPKTNIETEIKNDEKKKHKTAWQPYEIRKKEAGIWKITCLANGKFLLGSNLDINGPFSRHRAMQSIENHPIKAIQHDWNQFGKEGFNFEVLETISKKAEASFNQTHQLKTLKQKWIDKMMPLKGQWYNEGEPF
ncbi:metalloregulator ArsR/SmtB family transcription factor [bacterium]|nr:metalloregulator ArsR/SmtB family transcription factor [bacterium]